MEKKKAKPERFRARWFHSGGILKGTRAWTWRTEWLSRLKVGVGVREVAVANTGGLGDLGDAGGILHPDGADVRTLAVRLNSSLTRFGGSGEGW